MAEKTRYSDAELEEFRAIIMEKLELAQRDYDQLKMSLMGLDGNDTDDTSPTYKVLEEGANTLSKEETTRLAQRQLKFIQGLQAALVRIENKTYGNDALAGGALSNYWTFGRDSRDASYYNRVVVGAFPLYCGSEQIKSTARKAPTTTRL